MAPMISRWTSYLATCACVIAIAMPFPHVLASDPAARAVKFHSAVYPPSPFQVRRAKRLGKTLQPAVGQELSGRLLTPVGSGRFAAVVLMHGCHGPGQWNEIWSTRLVSWGYVVLDVDGFGPRGHASVCGRPTVVAGPTRAFDAFGAAQYLAKLPFVEAGRIAVMGMSHGGWAILNAINAETTARLRAKPFRAAVALYPWCAGPAILNAPVMILAAGQDKWTPAQKCVSFVKQIKTDHQVAVKVYPSAHHMFDVPGRDSVQLGYTLRHNPKAEADAVARIKAFLAETLR